MSKEKITQTVERFNESIRCIRGSTLSAALIDSVRVNFWGSSVNLCSVALVTKDSNRIIITPYTSQDVGDINNQLNKLGYNSYVFSKEKVMINIPPPTLEERKKVIGQINKLAEEAKIAIRMIRKNWRNSLSANELERQDDEIQKLVDDAVYEIDESVKDKITSL